MKNINRQQILNVLNACAPALALAVVFALFAAFAPPGFTSLRNVEAIVRQTTIVGIAALGMTMVIIAGGIDLSVGSVIALTTVVIALLLQAGVPPVLAVAAAVVLAGVCGIINGMLITRLKLMPFIATLGSLLVFRGIAKGLGNEQKVDAPVTWLNELLRTLTPEHQWMIVPPGVWLLLALSLGTFAVLRYTRFGLRVKSVGSSEATARLCGVPVDKMKVVVYGLSGVFAALAGVMQFSRLTVGDPTVADGLELDVIAAVVIGGGSLKGGRGSVVGTILGALMMTTIRSGCSQLNLLNWVQQIVAGSIIIIAVTLDHLRQRAARAN
jgi:ribose/xylose/arabinose/galactoside ABC-type transport system permease subunit